MKNREKTKNRQLFPIILMAVLFCPVSLWGFTAPLGIPTPPWPPDLDVARPAPPSPWTEETASNYFVERSAAGCSDSRTYGTPAAPRCSLPTAPAAGSKIYVRGTYAVGMNITWTGTSANPIWLTYYDSASRPLFTGISPQPLYFAGNYIIVDGIRSDLGGATNDQIGMYGNNLMIRDSTFRNTFGGSGGCGLNTGGTNLVFYKGTVYDQGNWQYVGSDTDRHGFKISPPTNGLWILDSLIYHVQGDGVQVGDQNNTAAQVNRVFVGRTTSYENLQSCLWTKNATDVIFSQNTCYNITAPGSNSGDGQGLGGQYDPKYVWFIANHVYNTKSGIKIQGPSSGGGGPWYFIGNLIHDVDADGNCNNYGMGAIAYRNDGGAVAVFNTVYNVDSFVTAPVGGTIVARNNIFSGKQGLCPATQVDITFTHDYNLWSSSAYDPGTEAHRQVEAAPSTFTSAGTNFTLKTTSLAKDTANPAEEAAFASFQSRYGVNIRKDFIGAARPYGSRWDIGAYEYSSGATLPKPIPPAILGIQ